MRRGLFVLWSLLMLPGLAWAEYQATPAARPDLGELTSEMKTAVPALEGCTDTHGTVTCRRLTGEFSPAERDALTATLAAHDPQVGATRKAKRNLDRTAAKAALKAVNPLTDAQIEALVGK